MSQNIQTSLSITSAADFLKHFGSTDIAVPVGTKHIAIRLSNDDFATLPRPVLNDFDTWITSNTDGITADIAVV